MKEEDFCPYCDEFVEFEFSDEYYCDFEPGEEADVCECSKCGKEVSMSWSISHDYHFTMKEDKPVVFDVMEDSGMEEAVKK